MVTSRVEFCSPLLHNPGVPDVSSAPLDVELELLARLVLALALCTAIGLEREFRQKSAGVRTYALVGLGSAVLTLISKHGFLDTSTVGAYDGSRIAAQVVSGIGFIGGGLIFVRRDAVQGLTTASVVWLAAAIGMACGAGMPVIAVVAVALHFAVTLGYAPIMRRLPRPRFAPTVVRLVYEDGRGVLREALLACTERRFAVEGVRIERPGVDAHQGVALVGVVLELQGRGSVAELASGLQEVDGIRSVSAAEHPDE